MVKFREHLRRRFERIRPALCAALCVAVGLGCALGWIWNTQRVVIITDTEGLETVRVSSANSLKRLLQESGLQLGPYDEGVITSIENGVEKLHIERGWAVNVTADGESVTLRMAGGTVAEALEKAGVTLGEEDYSEPEADVSVADEMTIAVHRVAYTEYQQEEVVEPETVYVPTSLFYRTKSKEIVRTDPKAGTVLRTYRQKTLDGEVVSQDVIAEEVLEPVRNEEIAVYGEGAPVSDLTGPEVVDGVPVGYTALFTGKATGYSASATAKGASGRHLTYGTCAVNPNLIPYGSKLYITSTDGRFVYGYAIAADTGTAMMSGDVLIDLYYQTYEESCANAVIQVNVYVVPNEDE